MTIEPIHTRKFVADIQKSRAATADSMETIVGHIAGGAAATGVAVYSQLVDEANRLDAYDYVLGGFDDLPDGCTPETAPFEVLVSLAEAILEGLTYEMVQQARSPHRKTGNDQNEAYFYTLGDAVHKLKTAIRDDRSAQKLSAEGL